MEAPDPDHAVEAIATARIYLPEGDAVRLRIKEAYDTSPSFQTAAT